MSLYVVGLVGIGTLFAARPLCHVSRLAGAALIGAGLFLAAGPALASDEVLPTRDNSEIACTVSLRGLTRISLKDDRFASISKLTTGVETDDFTVVHEPTRGDIYLSLPDGYARSDVSFFGTTAKGFVYKFNCRAAGERAHQIFVENRDLLKETLQPAAAPGSPRDVTIALVQGMYAGGAVDGFELRQPNLDPVRVGPLKVRMISEYRGPDVSGRVLRIENESDRAVTLDETVIAPSNAVAVSVATPVLRPGQATTAYIVLPAGASK